MSSMTRYFPGGVETQVNGGGGAALPPITPGQFGMPSMPGMPDLSAIFAQRQRIEAEREARAARMQALQMRALTQGMDRDAELAKFDDSDRFRNALVGERDARMRGNVQDLQLRAMQQEQTAAENGPPLRMVGQGPNQIPGYGPDTNAMNAIQRRMFLPGSALMDSERDARAGAIRAGDDVPYDPSEDFDRQRRRAVTAAIENNMGGYRGNRITGIGEK